MNFVKRKQKDKIKDIIKICKRGGKFFHNFHTRTLSENFEIEKNNFLNKKFDFVVNRLFDYDKQKEVTRIDFCLSFENYQIDVDKYFEKGICKLTLDEAEEFFHIDLSHIKQITIERLRKRYIQKEITNSTFKRLYHKHFLIDYKYQTKNHQKMIEKELKTN